jgi:hypothetical protein
MQRSIRKRETSRGRACLFKPQPYGLPMSDGIVGSTIFGSYGV